jgi:hypothetical protein
MPILVLALIDPSLLVVTVVAKATLALAHEARMKVIEGVCAQAQHFLSRVPTGIAVGGQS